MVKIKGITGEEAKAISEYEELLFKKFPKRLSKIILFGSKARGNSRRGSDIDLLIVLTKNGSKTTKEIVTLTYQPIAKHMVDISPIVVVEDKFFRNWSPLLEHIKRDGITLWTNKKAKRNM